MAYTITSQCVGCDRCYSQCPTGAIQRVDQQYWINPTLCNSCVGHYSVPQCAASCPTNSGCIPDADEYWTRWFARYSHLVSRLRSPHSQSAYWEHWFDVYSDRLKAQFQARAARLSEAAPAVPVA
ncbi:MAG: 4Fe-4S binding protein [Synechococcales cyanobacterium C42_A2020_086]|jgi:Fe-S-cluster-containing dehydrogenase component|nr:4Fe-4S binding protein [Synechococcales cyanobacterium M58_A2018_015]MBF2074173.1 4Fe-4S binding protein [Synechococcales cyanobacterium C42_A2020_086]